MVNKVILVGHLGKDPELRTVASGSVCQMTLATSESWTDKQGERKERTEWHRIVIWGKQGELAARYLAKGGKAYVEGRIQTREWQDKDGNKRYTTEVVASNVVFLDSRGGGGGGGGYSEPPPPSSSDDRWQSDDAIPF